MAQKEIQVYEGVMLWNDTNFYANGKKKMSTGTITMVDTNGNPTDYRYVSFRSQVHIQSDAIGKNGMKGIKCQVHGYFEENTYKGETTMQIMVDKLFLEGYEQLAADAEAAGTPLPPVPAGTLPNTPIQPMVSNGMPAAPGAVNAPQPNIPTPTVPTHTLPAGPSGPSGPAVVAGGYVMPMGTNVALQPIQAAPQVPQVAQPVPTAPVAAPVMNQVPAPAVAHVAPKASKPAASLQPPVIPNLQPVAPVAATGPTYIPAGDLPE